MDGRNGRLGGHSVKYRADIDGLRALAILPVVAFHFGLERIAQGGFLGVDVFFVISGYLIASIIYADIDGGRYRLFDFYARRVRRLFPALFAMFAAVIVTVFFVAFPSEARDTGKTIVNAVLFLSNIAAYRSSGYFEQQSATTNPLLHTWSLSVEEQFYLVFPVIVFALRRFSPNVRIAGLAAIALGSFAAAAMTARTDPHAAFYLVQYRAWELGLGALIAIAPLPDLTRRWQAEVLGAAGIVLILGSMAAMSEATPFPVVALPPCIGVAAAIYAGRSGGTAVARLLGLAPLRFIGLISYSLYLWHWPVIVFIRYFGNPNRWEKLALIVVCIGLATLSWKFIEQPFRKRRHRAGTYETLKGAGFAVAATLLASVVVGDFSARFWDVPPRAQRVLAYINYNARADMRAGSCFLSTVDNDAALFRDDLCLRQAHDRKNVLILGDSHAADLGPGLRTNFPRINFLQATASGCKPVLQTTGRARCTELMRQVFENYLPRHHLDAIILSAQWLPGDAATVRATVAALRPYADRVYVFGPIAEYRLPLPRILARSVADRNADLAVSFRTTTPGVVDREFAAALADSAAHYVSVFHALCDPNCVVWARRDEPLLFDTGHLTRDGSILLLARLRRDALDDLPAGSVE